MTILKTNKNSMSIKNVNILRLKATYHVHIIFPHLQHVQHGLLPNSNRRMGACDRVPRDLPNGNRCPSLAFCLPLASSFRNVENLGQSKIGHEFWTLKTSFSWDRIRSSVPGRKRQGWYFLKFL